MIWGDVKMTHNRYRLIIVKDQYIYLQEWKYICEKSDGNSLYHWKHVAAWGTSIAEEILENVSESKREELYERYVQLKGYLDLLREELKNINWDELDKQEQSRIKKEIKKRLREELKKGNKTINVAS